MNTRQIERIHALQRRSDATCEEWQAATEDLRSAAGRRIFYSNYDRGNIPKEGGSALRPCGQQFLETLFEDLDAIGALVLVRPDRIPQTDAVELLRTVGGEVRRLRDFPILFPHPSVYQGFFDMIEPKLDSIVGFVNEYMHHWQNGDEALRERLREDFARARPTYCAGYAPWSQFLYPGAPTLRVAGYFSNPEEDGDVQVLPPVAESIISRWTEEYRDAEAAFGVGDHEGDYPIWDPYEEFDQLQVGWAGISQPFNVDYEEDGPDRPMPLTEAASMVERLVRMPHDMDDNETPQIMEMLHANEEEELGDDPNVRMSVVRRRGNPQG